MISNSFLAYSPCMHYTQLNCNLFLVILRITEQEVEITEH